MNYQEKNINELKALLKEKNLKTTGTKAILFQKLEQYDKEIEEEAKKFKVYVKTLMGAIYTIYIDSSKTILELKNEIENKHGCHSNKQRLYFMCNGHALQGDIMYHDGRIGKKVDDDKTLSFYGVTNGSFFELQVKLT